MEKKRKWEVSPRKAAAFLGYITCILFLIVFVSSRTKVSVNENTGTTTTDGVNAFGYFPTIVVSGCMEPEIMTNSINLIEVVPLDEIQVGEIVAFTFNNEMVTHRVIEKYTDDNGEWYLRTKGDANDFVDQILIRDYMVRGRLIKTWNNTAPIISRYLIAPGEFDSLAIAQTLIWIFVTLGLAVVAINWAWDFVIMFIKTFMSDENYIKELNKLKEDLRILNENIEYLDNLSHTSCEKGKTRFFNNLARARAMREIKANNESLKDMNNAIKMSQWLHRKGAKQ